MVGIEGWIEIIWSWFNVRQSTLIQRWSPDVESTSGNGRWSNVVISTSIQLSNPTIFQRCFNVEVWRWFNVDSTLKCPLGAISNIKKKITLNYPNLQLLDFFLGTRELVRDSVVNESSVYMYQRPSSTVDEMAVLCPFSGITVISGKLESDCESFREMKSPFG